MESSLARFFGGSPVRVLVQLVVFSFVVGLVLNVIGVSPFDIVDSAVRLVQRLYEGGFETLRWAWRYFVLGAVIVFPIWLIVRLVNWRRPPPRPGF
jgi:hypothetical protein